MAKIKKIAFFSVGFAFNRLARLKFYEEIFPKDVQIYLITTDKYFGKEKEKYQSGWDLKRTKIISLHYSPFRLPFQIRKVCENEKIERLVNLGYHTGAYPLMVACLFKNRGFVLNILTDLLNQYKYAKNASNFLYEMTIQLLMFPLFLLSKRIFLNDYENYKRVPFVYFTPKQKLRYLAAPVDTELFVKKDKRQSRDKLGIDKDAKVVLFVGRIEYLKCSDIFLELVSKNKDIEFIAIGRMMDPVASKSKFKNLKVLDKKTSKELVDYYNAADITFCLNRGSGGITLVAEESLACGTPIITSKKIPEKSEAVYQVKINSAEINRVINKYFSLKKDKLARIHSEARKYSKEHYSNNVWKERYLESHLNS